MKDNYLICLSLAILVLCPGGVHAKEEPSHQSAQVFADRANKIYLGTGDLEPAARDADQAIALEPRNHDWWELKAKILLKQQENEKALPCIEHAIELSPRSATAWVFKSMILSGLGRYSEALVAANRAVDYVSNTTTHFARARVLYSLGDFSDSEKDLDTVLKTDPHHAGALGQRMEIDQRLKRWNQVIAESSIVIAGVEPSRDAVHRALIGRAEAYTETKQYDKAIADYQVCAKRWPYDRKSHAGLLKLYTLTGNKTGATKERSALKDFDDDMQPL